MDNVTEISRPEEGQASILITLHDSRVTVIHASRGTVLLNGTVKKGWWNDLFKHLSLTLTPDQESP